MPIAVKQSLVRNAPLVSVIAQVAQLCLKTRQSRNKLCLFGNGGSAADAQHIAGEFVGRSAFERPALPALALSVNTSAVTAIGDDYSIKSFHVNSKHWRGPAMSSPVFPLVEIRQRIGWPLYCQKVGLHTLALTGSSGEKLRNCSYLDHCLCVPSNDTPRIQECHILIGHIISELVEQELFHAQGRVSRS